MSTQLDDDLRTAFAELAATTTIATDPRFGDIESRVVPASRRRWPVLVAAAACIALVIGLAVAARDRTPEAPAPADTAVDGPSTTLDTIEEADTDGLVPPPPVFLFPAVLADGSALPSFDSANEAVDAYLGALISTRMSEHPGTNVTATVTHDDIAPDATQATVSFEMIVQSAVGTDSGSGVVRVVRTVDANGIPGSWFVETAGIGALSIDAVQLVDGTLSGTLTSAIGGTYEIAVREVAPIDNDSTVALVADSTTIVASTGANTPFTLDGFAQPNVAVTIWHQPDDTVPYPLAMFAEFIVSSDRQPEPHISVDDAVAETATTEGEPLSLGLSTSTWPTPTEAVAAYLAERATNGGSAVGYSVDPVVGHLGGDVQALVRFELSGTEGVANVFNGGDAGNPAWSVMIAGTTGLTFRDTIVDGDRVTAIVTSAVNATVVVTAHDVATGAGVGSTTAEVGPAGTSVVVDIAGVANDVSLRVRAPDSTMFGEVPATGGWLFVEFDSFLAQYADLIDDEVTVPPLIGLTEAQARNAIERASLAANVTYVDVPAGDDRDGTVIEQDLVVGSSVGMGAAVAVTVAVASVP